MGEQSERGVFILRRLLRHDLEQPLLHQRHFRALLHARDFQVFLAIHQRHRRIEAQQRHTDVRQFAQLPGIAQRRAVERREEALHVQRFAIGAERRQIHLITQTRNQLDQISQQRCFEVAREGILHDDHTALALRRGQRRQGRNRRWLHLPTAHCRVEIEATEQRHVDHAADAFQQPANPCSAHQPVVQRRNPRHVRDAVFQRGDQVIPRRAQITAVIQLKKTRTKLRHIDLDRALSRTGFARQATGHGVVDFVGEVFGLRTTVAPALPQ
ncbi:hypothetical protein D3C72_1154060 [compost metagenome]